MRSTSPRLRARSNLLLTPTAGRLKDEARLAGASIGFAIVVSLHCTSRWVSLLSVLRGSYPRIFCADVTGRASTQGPEVLVARSARNTARARQDLDVIPGQGNRRQGRAGSGLRLMQQGPSHVCGAMKSRGLRHRRAAPQVTGKVEEREGWKPLDRPPTGRSCSSAVDTVVPSNVRWSPVTLMRSSHPSSLMAARCGNDKPTNLSVDGLFHP
jgi:hypothetical protein